MYFEVYRKCCMVVARRCVLGRAFTAVGFCDVRHAVVLLWRCGTQARMALYVLEHGLRSCRRAVARDVCGGGRRASWYDGTVRTSPCAGIVIASIMIALCCERTNHGR